MGLEETIEKYKSLHKRYLERPVCPWHEYNNADDPPRHVKDYKYVRVGGFPQTISWTVDAFGEILPTCMWYPRVIFNIIVSSIQGLAQGFYDFCQYLWI